MIVVGGSMGGARALQCVLRGVSPAWRVPVVVCLHRHKSSASVLRDQLQTHCAARVAEIVDKQPIEAGSVYLVPPDYHALVERGYFSLSIDEPVQYARPSIDVLFESAADAAIAVILTGAGEDGARGCARVAERGGVVLIQEPASAERAEMPNAARRCASSARVLPLGAIAAVLEELVKSG